MKEYNLLAMKNHRSKAKRNNKAYRSKPKASHQMSSGETDTTKAIIPEFGWLYLVIVLDWHTEKIVGYSISTRSKIIEIKQIFASYNNPKSNADTERVMIITKKYFVWTRYFSSPDEFTGQFSQEIKSCNNNYPHSSLNYQTPYEFEKERLVLTKI